MQTNLDKIAMDLVKGVSVQNKKRKHIEELQKEIDLFLNTRITDRLHIDYSIPINYSRFTDEQKKSICLLLIYEIRLHENGDMEIAWKI